MIRNVAARGTDLIVGGYIQQSAVGDGIDRKCRPGVLFVTLWEHFDGILLPEAATAGFGR